MITVCIAAVITVFITIRMIRFNETIDIISKITGVIRPFIIGICLAYLLNFLYKRIISYEESHIKCLKSVKARKVSALIITYTLVFGTLSLLIIATVPSLSSSIKGITDNLPRTIENLKKIVDDFLKDNKWVQSVLGSDVGEFQEKAQDLIVNNLNYDGDFVRDKAFELVGGTFTYAISILVAIIVSVMLLANKESMLEQTKRAILALFGEDKSRIIFDEMVVANKKFSSFLIGKLIDSVIIGIITFLCCLILGINYSALIALIVGITNIIPIIGPFIGGGLSLIIVFSQSPRLSLHFIIFILILQQVDGNIIGPKCIGNSLDLNSFWVLFAIFTFGNMFGFIGMIIGVPLFAVIYDIAGKVINNKIKKQTKEKEISINDKIWVTDDKVECTYTICKVDNTDIES